MGWEFVIPGYLVVFGSLGAYTAWLMRRARTIANRLPEDKRRFLD